MDDNILALLGGSPVLRRELPPYNTFDDKEKNAVMEVMNSGLLSGFLGRAGKHFLGGPKVLEFERLFKEYFRVKHCVSFNSATTALQATVAAAGIGPGDQVITSPYTMSATATAILLNNAVPVFADIEEDSFCLNPADVEKKITGQTKAILTVNLFGRTPEYDALRVLAKKYNLKIIEDNAQAIGATHKGQYAGTIGDIGVFSFNVHKIVQCGEGGMLITNNDEYAFRAQLVRNHGEVVIGDLMEQNELFTPIMGSNYRLSELHAAVGIEQFKKMEILNSERIELAEYLTEKLKRFDWLVTPVKFENSKHVYYVYPLRILKDKIGITRETFIKAMKAEGFNLGVSLSAPLYFLPLYQKKQPFPRSQFPFVSKEYPHNVNYEPGICPVAERLCSKELFHTTICQRPQTTKELDLFICAVEKIERNIGALKKYEESKSANT
ncbi:MAG: hypothetical protein A2787_09815 [Omnitrophica WOR_2 bacterium RIFCSPHIGHO2_01_FULL_48_9]|nr:MAG: hypothetical protein A2787_09815 [Omnitrophica WOR_2 bacterium RIFCSPHIGHO2_01_FULL_48_9]